MSRKPQIYYREHHLFYAFIAPVALFFLFGLGGSWLVAAILLICVPLIPGAIITVQKIAKKILSKYWGQYTKLGSTFLENLQGMTTLKTYQADGYKNEEMNRESEHFRKVTMAVLTMQLNSVTIMDFVAYGGAALGILLVTKLNKLTGVNLALANTFILFFDMAMLILCTLLYSKGIIGFDGLIIPLIALMSSFGPVTALANLGTTLQATAASGARVLAIIDEQPETKDITGRESISFSGAATENVTFSYGGETVLKDLNVSFHKTRSSEL